ncbi:MAG TPA: restriction endonuclease [Porphyromonadaceae bacterium]|nr:restriction endonuclease [Porphyromonadaceae bacterium]
MYHKAPFNYIGNKHRIIGFLEALFPKDISTFVDLFCGGGDVLINIRAATKIANDVNYHLIEIMEEFQRLDVDDVLCQIQSRIHEWGLNKTDAEAFYKFRSYYNKTRRPLDLYVLVCFGFNYQFRFNSRHEFNNPFGKNRSCFSENMRKNLISFVELIRDVTFSKCDFRDVELDNLKKGDFVYADPPYTLTCGAYNDGKRGFKGWSLADDTDLTAILDRLNEKGVAFAFSDVIEHKGKIHPFLSDWAKDKNYNIHYLDVDYNNCNYQNRNCEHSTIEVVITNY